MGTFYNSRVLEWFECGRTEWLRTRGVPYAEMEERGFFLPIVESHVKYQGRARYDDLLAVATTADFIGRARVRFDVTVSHEAEGSPVASGYTVHAIANAAGKPVRPPEWLVKALAREEKSP